MNKKQTLIAFLYQLMRDELTPGRTVAIIKQIESAGTKDITFTNKHLEAMAAEYADRILAKPKKRPTKKLIQSIDAQAIKIDLALPRVRPDHIERHGKPFSDRKSNRHKNRKRA